MDGQSTTHVQRDDLRPAAFAGDLIAVLVGLLLASNSSSPACWWCVAPKGRCAVTASPGWLIVWMALAVAVAAATHLTVGRRWHSSRNGRCGAGYLPAAALILTALALTSFRAPWVVFLIWAMVAVEEGAMRSRIRDGLSGTLDRIGIHRPHRWPGTRAPFKSGIGAPEGDEPPPAATARLSPMRPNLAGGDGIASTTQFSQRFERVRSIGGGDLLAGTLTARPLPRDRSRRTVHVAFCPPFPRVPQLDFRQVAGPPARIKVGQTLPHGVRFDVKLEGPTPNLRHFVSRCEHRTLRTRPNHPLAATRPRISRMSAKFDHCKWLARPKPRQWASTTHPRNDMT